ncbi:hypothetical protein AR691_17375 [Bacillus amyloliquefaciens]|nr:hypothetical protein AR691_17375 [Bacillus amyloliquefaciens]
MTNWKEEIGKVKQCPQRQDTTLDQLIDLYGVATKLGFYDAGDIIRNIIEKNPAYISNYKSDSHN